MHAYDTVPCMPNPTTHNGPWLTTTQLAKSANVSRSTIVRAVQAGLLQPSRTPGGHWRFTHHDITKLLKAAS